MKTPGAKLIKEADIEDNDGRLHLVQDDATRLRLQEKYEGVRSLLEELA